jgi:hypothetical protein
MSVWLGDVAVVVVAGAAGIVSWWMRLRADAMRAESGVGVADDRVWEAGHQLGLSVPFDRYWPATGRVEGVSLEIEVVRRSGDAQAERELVVRLLPTVPTTLRLRREDRADALSTDDLVVGEPRFDTLLRVQAPHELEARALLDGPTRDAVFAAAELGAGLDDGRVGVRADCTNLTAPQILKTVRAAVRAHAALRARLAAVRADPVAALNALARADRAAGVRLRVLDHLVRSGLAERETLRVRAEDVDPGIRLLAAHALGADGHAALEKLARTGSRTIRVRAAAHLAESNQLPPDRQQLVEDTFLAALDDPELVRTALLGLGRRGTARAVLPVRDLAAGERLVGDGAPQAEIRRLADGVLASIRARLDASASGGVSLAPELGGDVAIASSPGALSPPTVDLG